MQRSDEDVLPSKKQTRRMSRVTVMAKIGGTGRALLGYSFILPSTAKRLSFPRHFYSIPLNPHRVLQRFRPLCSSATVPATVPATFTVDEDALQPVKHGLLLEKLRLRHLKDSAKAGVTAPVSKLKEAKGNEHGELAGKNGKRKVVEVSSFEELGLSEEVMGALEEMGISLPTEIQAIGIPAVLHGKSVVLGSHTGSGKTLAYLLPIVQVMFHIYLLPIGQYIDESK